MKGLRGVTFGELLANAKVACEDVLSLSSVDTSLWAHVYPAQLTHIVARSHTGVRFFLQF